MTPGGTLHSSVRSSFEARKYGTRFCGTLTIAPVFGFRPARGFRTRVAKLPKPRISTRSPLESARVIAPKMSSRISFPSFRLDSQFRAISLESSAFVNFPDISSWDTTLSAKSSAARQLLRRYTMTIPGLPFSARQSLVALARVPVRPRWDDKELRRLLQPLSCSKTYQSPFRASFSYTEAPRI